GADDLVQPGPHDRVPDLRGDHPPPEGEQEAGARAGDRDLDPGGDAPPAPGHRRLPAPVERRPAPAGDDRDGALLQPEPADCRRADYGAGRDDPGSDPRPAAPSPG